MAYSDDPMTTQAGSPAPDERRGTLRLDLPRTARAICAGPDVEVVVVECSLTGIGLVAEAPIAAGRSFAILTTTGAISVLAYEVVHCRPSGDGRFRIGARLVTSNVANPTADDLLAALASL